MAKMDVTVSVEKSGYEVMQALVDLVKAVKVEHKAGDSLPVEITADITAAVQKLGPIVAEVQQIPADAVEDRKAMLKGLLISAADLAEAVLA